MAYQGLFPKETRVLLKLPRQLWSPSGIEFNGLLSFIKGGLAYADRIVTVSPNYAAEIQTPDFGCGLEGLLSYRKDDLFGIINGIDFENWNPEIDTNITEPYSALTLDKKRLNKTALQQKYSLTVDNKIPILAVISRLVEQKGIDLILECLPELLSLPLQFILHGRGNKYFEQQLSHFGKTYPKQIVIILGYDEVLAHQIEAGADILLMPSLFEPCGLNQLYSQRYGTIPVARKTGGLADTIIDVAPETIRNKTATGFIFNKATSGAFIEAIKRSLIVYSNAEKWTQLQVNGMQKDCSWNNSAKEYIELYEQL
jgi:starch synthase